MQFSLFSKINLLKIENLLIGNMNLKDRFMERDYIALLEIYLASFLICPYNSCVWVFQTTRFLLLCNENLKVLVHVSGLLFYSYIFIYNLEPVFLKTMVITDILNCGFLLTLDAQYIT